MEPAREIENLLSAVKRATDEKLTSFFEDQNNVTSKTDADLLVLHLAVKELTMRAGKRFRPMLIASGLACMDGEVLLEKITSLGASMELLQSYLLIHDDWMDRDETRRGGLSTFAHFRTQHKDPHLADSLAILAGDLASTYAWHLFLETDFPKQKNKDAQKAFLSIHNQVYWGQLLDLTAHTNISLMHQLKTTSYTIEGPLLLGSLLAEKPSDTSWVHEISAPLGKAFQYRDDWLGTFGDPEATGKPRGNDLREGKINAISSFALEQLKGDDLTQFKRTFGDKNATENQIQGLVELLEKYEINHAVLKSLENIKTQFLEKLLNAKIKPLGKNMLEALTQKMVIRNH